MQAAQCSSFISSQMWPGACRKSPESLYLGIVFLPVLSFDFVFLLQGILQEGGAQTSGISVSLMPLGFLENYQARYFCSGNNKFRCIWDCCSVTICIWDAIEGKAWLGNSVSLIFSVWMWVWPHGMFHILGTLLWESEIPQGSAQGQMLATPSFHQMLVDLTSRSSMPKEIWTSFILMFCVGKGLSSDFLPRINWESHRVLLAVPLSNLTHARRKVSLFCTPYAG